GTGVACARLKMGPIRSLCSRSGGSESKHPERKATGAVHSTERAKRVNAARFLSVRRLGRAESARVEAPDTGARCMSSDTAVIRSMGRADFRHPGRAEQQFSA